jgi:putative Holliday junction resolvase
MAIDYGRRHLGIALSDPSRVIASPLRTVDIATPEHGIKVAAALAVEWGVTDLVVGLPRRLCGEEGSMALEVRAWGARLNSASGIPVHFVDERLTTAEAEQVRHLTKRRMRSDDIAAALVLQVFLEGER